MQVFFSKIRGEYLSGVFVQLARGRDAQIFFARIVRQNFVEAKNLVDTSLCSEVVLVSYRLSSAYIRSDDAPKLCATVIFWQQLLQQVRLLQQVQLYRLFLEQVQQQLVLPLPRAAWRGGRQPRRLSEWL